MLEFLVGTGIGVAIVIGVILCYWFIRLILSWKKEIDDARKSS